MKGRLDKGTALRGIDMEDQAGAPREGENGQDCKKGPCQDVRIKLGVKIGLRYGSKNHRRYRKVINESVCRTHKLRRHKALFPGKPSECNNGKYWDDCGYDIHCDI